MRLRLRNRCLRLCDSGLVNDGINFKQHIAFRHGLTLGKQTFCDDAGDLRAHLCLGRSDNASGQGCGKLHVLRLHRHDGDGSGRAIALLRRCGDRHRTNSRCKGGAAQPGDQGVHSDDPVF